MTHLHSIHAGFSIAGLQERSSENTKSIKTLGGWKTPLRELTSLLKPKSRPSPKLRPRSQHFELPASALGAEATGRGT